MVPAVGVGRAVTVAPRPEWTVFACPGCRGATFWARLHIKVGVVEVLCTECEKTLTRLEVEKR
jgi:predicted RNA-binding Zn-ribbon protein involved in translation (DUF1610 family)